MIIPFHVGDRVVHTKTEGRIRGTVEEIWITRRATRVVVMVDGLKGRCCDYLAQNIELESESIEGGKPNHPPVRGWITHD